MGSFRRTLSWVLGTAVGLFLLLSGAGYFFLTSHHNEHAQTILRDHAGAIVSAYLRIGAVYVFAGLAAAFVLHPFVRSWKAALATLGIAFLGLLFTLTSDTHLLYGPVQTIYCAVHDMVPAFLRNLYQPWLIPAGLGAWSVWSLHRWTRRFSAKAKGTATAVLVVAGVPLVFFPRGVVEKKFVGPPNFVLIATDSLRADHIHANGYKRETTPHIDALAKRGTNFSRLLVPTASTHESWISMLSSTEPRQNGLRHMFPSRAQVESIRKAQTFLPQVLTEEGYETGVIGGWCGTTFRLLDAGYQHIDVSQTQNHLALIAEAAFTNHLLVVPLLDNPVGRWLVPELERVSFTRSTAGITKKGRRFLRDMRGGHKPFMLTLIYHMTHLPYSASHPHYLRYTDPDYRGDNRYRINFAIDEMIQKGFEHSLSDEDKQHIINLYDGCVFEFDAQVGAIVAELKELGLLENTIVGVWADHGDDLYEHGTTLGHGVSLFGGDQANQVPAVFAGPGVPNRRVDTITRSIDLAPTWLSWLGIDDRPATWTGVDLSGDVPPLTALLETSYLLYRQPVPDLKPGEKVKDFPKFDRATYFDPEFDHNLVLRADLAQMVIDTKCFAARENDLKLISVPGESGRIFRLFDLARDPECRRDLTASRPDDVARLKKMLPEHAR